MVVAVPMAVWGPLVCLASALGHHLASLGILRLLAGQHPALAAADLQFAANWAVSMLQAAAVTALGLLACWHTGADTAAADLPLMLPCGWWNLGYWLYDLLALFLLANQGREGGLAGRVGVFVRWWPGMVAHHLGVIAFMALGVLSPTRAGQGGGLIAMGLLTEASSVPVAARGLLARLGMKGRRVYLYTSIAMVATFLAARVVLVPGVVVLYSLQRGLSPAQGFLSIPLKCRLGTAAFYALNLHWFFLMVRGCLRLARGGKLD